MIRQWGWIPPIAQYCLDCRSDQNLPGVLRRETAEYVTGEQCCLHILYTVGVNAGLLKRGGEALKAFLFQYGAYEKLRSDANM